MCVVSQLLLHRETFIQSYQTPQPNVSDAPLDATIIVTMRGAQSATKKTAKRSPTRATFTACTITHAGQVSSICNIVYDNIWRRVFAWCYIIILIRVLQRTWAAMVHRKPHGHACGRCFINRKSSFPQRHKEKGLYIDCLSACPKISHTCIIHSTCKSRTTACCATMLVLLALQRDNKNSLFVCQIFA